MVAVAGMNAVQPMQKRGAVADLDPLILDFLEWLSAKPRSYADVMENWRTSCPRLTVWEDAIDRGFVERTTVPQSGSTVSLTLSGRAFLGERRLSHVVSHAMPYRISHE